MVIKKYKTKTAEIEELARYIAQKMRETGIKQIGGMPNAEVLDMKNRAWRFIKKGEKMNYPILNEHFSPKEAKAAFAKREKTKASEDTLIACAWQSINDGREFNLLNCANNLSETACEARQDFLFSMLSIAHTLPGVFSYTLLRVEKEREGQPAFQPECDVIFDKETEITPDAAMFGGGDEFVSRELEKILKTQCGIETEFNFNPQANYCNFEHAGALDDKGKWEIQISNNRPGGIHATVKINVDRQLREKLQACKFNFDDNPVSGL